MNTKICAIFLFFCGFYAANLLCAQTLLFPVKEGQKWGFMDTKGRIQVAPEYDFVKPFMPNGTAIVQKNKKLGLIDTNNKPLLPCQYELLDTLHPYQHLFLAKTAQQWQLIDNTQKVILDGISGKVNALTADFFMVENKDGLGLYHSRKGCIILPQKNYTGFEIPNEDYIVVHTEQEKVGLFHAQRKMILEPDFQQITVSKSHIYARQKHKWGVYDTLVYLRADFLFSSCQYINPYLVKVGYGLDEQHIYSLPEKTNKLSGVKDFAPFGSLGFLVKANNSELLGLIDTLGNVLFPPSYRSITPLGNGFYLAQNAGNMQGLLDSNFRVQMPFEYQNISLFHGEVFKTYTPKGTGLYNIRLQKEILPACPQHISELSEDVALVSLTSNTDPNSPNKIFYRIINKKGEITWQQTDTSKLKEISLDNNQLSFLPENKKSKSILSFDSLGALVDNSVYNNYGKLKVRKRTNDGSSNLPSGGWRNNRLVDTSLQLNEFLYWEYSNLPKVQKWGIKDLRDTNKKKWHFPPTFHTLIRHPKHGFTLGVINNSAELELRFDNIFVDLKNTLTWINNEKGLPVTGQEFVDVRITDFTVKNLSVARCVFKDGTHGLVSKKGKILLRSYRFIGDFYEGKAKASKVGTLNASINKSKFPPLQTLGQYLNFQTPHKVSSAITQTYLEQLMRGALYCEDAKWGVVDTNGAMILPFEYEFLREFKNGHIAGIKKGIWGLWDTKNQPKLEQTYNHMQFLPNSDSNLYQITQYVSRYGCVDTHARLIIPIDYERIRQLSDGSLGVKKDGKWGFVASDGHKISECEYDEIHDFCQERAAVLKKGRWGFIDKSGRLAIQHLYSKVGNFSEGRAWVQLTGGKMGFVDLEGELVVSGKWFKLGDFHNGAAPAKNDQQAWGILDMQGNWLMSPSAKFEDLKILPEPNLALGKIDDKFVLLNHKGEILSAKYAIIRPFQEGVAVVRKNFVKSGILPVEDDWSFIDTLGQLVAPLKYEKLGDFHNGRACYYDASKHLWGYIDKTGAAIIPAAFFEARDFSENRAIVYVKHNQSGLIDTTGQVILQPKQNKIVAYTEQICLLRQNSECYYYVSEDLKRIFPLIFEDAQPFGAGVAGVRKGGKWGLVNAQGLWAIQPKYQKMQSFKNGYAQVGVEHLYGVVDNSGKVIIPPLYETVVFIGNGLFRVENGDKIGYLNIQGEWIRPMTE